MNDDQKYSLFLDAARTIRSLADVFEAIAETVKGTAKEVNAPPAGKEVTLEEVRAVLAQKSQAGMTAGVRELIMKYGGTRLSDIEPAQYRALLKEAEVLGNE